MNWNLNVCTSFKQTTDGERGSGIGLSGFVQENISANRKEAEIVAD